MSKTDDLNDTTNAAQNNGRRIEAVIFDLDDTLLDWSAITDNEWEAKAPFMTRVYTFLQRCGQTLPDEATFRTHVQQHIAGTWKRALETLEAPSLGRMWRESLETLNCDLTAIDIDELMRAYEWGATPGVQPYPDAIPLLEELRRRRYKIGLVTNASMPMWMRDVELREYGLLKFFDARITSGDSRFIKPHPAVYHRVLNLLETAAERAVFVGDDPAHDIVGANKVGLTSVLIDPPHLNRPLNGVVPDFTITSPSELLPILEELEEEPSHE